MPRRIRRPNGLAIARVSGLSGAVLREVGARCVVRSACSIGPTSAPCADTSSSRCPSRKLEKARYAPTQPASLNPHRCRVSRNDSIHRRLRIGGRTHGAAGGWPPAGTPEVGLRHPPHPVREALQVVIPLVGREVHVRAVEIVDDQFDDAVQQVFPPLDVVIQRHSLDAEVGAQPSQGQVSQIVLVDQRDRGQSLDVPESWPMTRIPSYFSGLPTWSGSSCRAWSA